MIRYYANFMGPVSLDWYQKRGLSQDEYWAGGRIDIYGLDENEYFSGQTEYSLPVMDGESWNKFSEWLKNYKTEELKPYKQLLSAFEAATEHKIRWAHEEFGDE